ncbi:hypothetical protein GUH47_27535, partial [Xanthomonas citri pv. citri]|nr:hypothetical protein [Xanthomonas citri pv. citri]
MTAQSKKIAEVILGLDLNDDALWTQDGLPRINVVAEAAGLPGLTRADITEAGSGLNR